MNEGKFICYRPMIEWVNLNLDLVRLLLILFPDHILLASLVFKHLQNIFEIR